MNDIALKDMVERMTPSDRLIVQNSYGEDLYNGFVANFCHSEIVETRRVKRFGLHTKIFLKVKREKYINESEPLKKEIPVEIISDFKFSDLEMLIYTKVILED